jgi:hypothetical protein
MYYSFQDIAFVEDYALDGYIRSIDHKILINCLKDMQENEQALN